MTRHKFGLLSLWLATACGSGLDPAREPGRNACHLEANVRAEQAWQAQCGESRWADCPDAEEITDALRDDLEACDAEAYGG